MVNKSLSVANAESLANSADKSMIQDIKSSPYYSDSINNSIDKQSSSLKKKCWLHMLGVLYLAVKSWIKLAKNIKDKPENHGNKTQEMISSETIQVHSDPGGSSAQVKGYSSSSQKSLKDAGYNFDGVLNLFYIDDSKHKQNVSSDKHSSSDLTEKPLTNDKNTRILDEAESAQDNATEANEEEVKDEIKTGDEVVMAKISVVIVNPEDRKRRGESHRDECEERAAQIRKQMLFMDSEINKLRETESKEMAGQKLNGDNHESPDSRSSSDTLSDLVQHQTFRLKPQELTLCVYMIPDGQSHPHAIDDIPWKWLQEEKWRLHTYARYPHKTAKSALLLAADGFAYIGSGKGSDDTVICYFCCSQKRSWQELDVIPEVHKRLSPQCSMVTGINCNNVPMTAPQRGAVLFEQLQNKPSVSDKSGGNRPSQSGQNGDEIQSDSVPDVTQPQRTATSATPGNKQSNGKPVQMAQTTIMRPPVARPPPRSAVITSTVIAHQPASENVPTATVTSVNRLANNTGSGSQAIRASTPSVGTTAQNGQQRQTPTAATNISSTANTNSASSANGARSTTSPATSNTSVTQNNNSTSRNPTPAQTRAATSSTTASSNSYAPTTNGSTANTTQNSSTNSQGSRSNRGPTYSDLGIITERPKRYEFAVKAKRLESFGPWPRDHHLKKEDLADAGFYYAGYGDCARCFYCGGGLRNWEDEDNVWIEHARWFPKCAYIRQTMGQAFVDAVQDLNQSNDTITFAMIEEKLGSIAETFKLGGSREEPLKRDPAVLTVIDMGYSEKDCLEAAKYVKDVNGILSADKIFEKLVQDEKVKIQKCNDAESQVVGISSDPSRDEETLRTLKDQNNQLRQQTVCKICMDKEVAVVFLPCGHLVSCTDCASAMKDCPVCRNQVKGIVRAFMG